MGSEQMIKQVELVEFGSWLVNGAVNAAEHFLDQLLPFETPLTPIGNSKAGPAMHHVAIRKR